MIRLPVAPALVLGLALTFAGPAAAQPAAPDADELLALKFYVQQDDGDAVSAELRRLQLKYPDWIPPEDLSRIDVTAPSTEIDSFYRHVADGRFDEARAVLAEARRTYPDWQPPEEMIDLLEVAEGQLLLDEALASDQLDDALDLARARPGLLRCDRINNAWRIAEAQQKAGRDADALGTYRAVLGACLVPDELSATLEKADAVASEPELRALFTQVIARFPEDEDRYDALRMRLLAGRGAATGPETAAGDGARDAGGSGRGGDALQGAAAPASVPRNDPRPGPRPAPRPDPGQPTRSAPASRGAPPAAAHGSAGALGAMVAAGDWAGCLQATAGATTAGAIYQRGWCAYSLDQPMEAIAAFQGALNLRLDATQRRDAAYGIALAYLKLHMPEEAARIAASTDFARDQRIEVERQILDQRGVLAYKKGRYRQAIQYFDALEQVAGGIRRDLAILRAYAYLRAGNRAQARSEFQRLNDALSTRESRAGLRAASD